VYLFGTCYVGMVLDGILLAGEEHCYSLCLCNIYAMGGVEDRGVFNWGYIATAKELLFQPVPTTGLMLSFLIYPFIRDNPRSPAF
jgi:hypothetical protein